MSPKPRSSRPIRRPRRLRAVGWLLLLLASLLGVTWRQTRGLALESELRERESERAVAETERVELVRRIEELRSRARVVRVARERLDMHLPSEGEIVYLPVPTAAGSVPAATAADEEGR